MFGNLIRFRRFFVVALCLALLTAALGAFSVSADSTVVVKPANTTTAVAANVCPGLVLENWTGGWGHCDENDTVSPGSVDAQTGPGTPPAGTGSARFTVNDSGDGPHFVTVYQNGLRLDDITQINYDTYFATGDGADNRPYLFINVDYDLTDASTNWQGRLIWVPDWAGCTSLAADTWETLDPVNNGVDCWLQTGTPRVGDVVQAPLFPHLGVTAGSWADILSNYPDAGIHTLFGAVGFKMGSGYSTGAASLDKFQIGADTGGGPDVTTWDFEPITPCTTVCYADAVNGNDLNGGGSPAEAKKTIQAAIDAVSAGGQVRVLPGSYDETATNRDVLGAGNYQFGLFFEETAKNGVSLLGVTAGDVEITDPTATEAVVTTNATNNFGWSGIFVEADGVTIGGLEIGPNDPGNNKTIEVIGDAFTLKNSYLNVPDGASPYINDWRFDDVNDISYVESYTIDNNVFSPGGILSLASGAGYTGPVAGRLITNNVFTMDPGQTWPSISFNGDTTTVPWYSYPVGAATITGNSFTNNAEGGQHIRLRGIADDSTFDWASYWNDNTYNKAVVVGPNPLDDIRSFTYACGGYTCNDTRRIATDIQTELDLAVAGDTVLVNEGTYPESPRIDTDLTLVSDDGRDLTILDLQPQPAAPTYLGSLIISADNVTVDGFTFEGFDADCAAVGSQTQANTNLFIESGLTSADIDIVNNRFQVGQIGACSFGDDGIGIGTYYDQNNDYLASLLVENNIFEPLTGAGGSRAFFINPGTVDFTFRGNEINGLFSRGSFTQAKNGLVEDNTVNGTGASGGLGTWGYPDPSLGFGKTTFTGNTISGAVNGIAIYETNDVSVHHNILDANQTGVRVGDFGLTYDPSTIHVNRNAITNNTTIGMNNTTAGLTADGACNWWAAADGPGPVGPGSGDGVSADVDFSDWLFTANLDGLCGEISVTGVFVSTVSNGSVAGVGSYNKEDILKYDIGSGTWSMFFDGSEAGLNDRSGDINAMHIGNEAAADDIYMSFERKLSPVPGLGNVAASDIVHYNGSTFSLYFEGSDVGLSTSGEGIDGLTILPGSASPIWTGCLAYLLISPTGGGAVTDYLGDALRFRGEDILGFCLTSSGAATDGKWHMVLDGDTEGMPPNSTYGLWAFNTSDTYLITQGDFAVDAALGGHSEVYKFDGSSFSGPTFSAPDAGLSPKVDAIHLGISD